MPEDARTWENRKREESAIRVLLAIFFLLATTIALELRKADSWLLSRVGIACQLRVRLHCGVSHQ